MELDIMYKIKQDKKHYDYLRSHTYWYKYLNRGSSYYKEFLNSYKNFKKNDKINKTNNILETVDTVNSILKILK